MGPSSERFAQALIVLILGLAACGSTSRRPVPGGRWIAVDASNSVSVGTDAGRPDLGPADGPIDTRPRADVGADSSGDAGRRDGDADRRDATPDGAPNVCTGDSDCGDLHLCSGGQCIPCHTTCLINADCVVGAVCFHRNSCTYCDPPDAGDNVMATPRVRSGPVRRPD